jgi:hypothetical protein
VNQRTKFLRSRVDPSALREGLFTRALAVSGGSKLMTDLHAISKMHLVTH